jgi:hypothetical protein
MGLVRPNTIKMAHSSRSYQLGVRARPPFIMPAKKWGGQRSAGQLRTDYPIACKAGRKSGKTIAACRSGSQFAEKQKAAPPWAAFLHTWHTMNVEIDACS